MVLSSWENSSGTKFTPGSANGLSKECYSGRLITNNCQRADGGRSEESGDTFFQHHDTVLDPSLARFPLQQLQRFVHRLVRQAERSIVPWQHPARFQVEEGAGSVGRIGVHVAERRGIVGANGKQRQLRRQAPPDFAKARKVSPVSRVIDRVLPGPQYIASIAAMRIPEDARAPVS